MTSNIFEFSLPLGKGRFCLFDISPGAPALP
jgi:hypothetical protein